MRACVDSEPLRQLQDSLACDPGSPIATVCALESSHYLRNQLLRDADWAGMAHSVEIRVPFVDASLLSRLAPAIAAFASGTGKTALARAATKRLPEDVRSSRQERVRRADRVVDGRKDRI